LERKLVAESAGGAPARFPAVEPDKLTLDTEAATSVFPAAIAEAVIRKSASLSPEAVGIVGSDRTAAEQTRPDPLARVEPNQPTADSEQPNGAEGGLQPKTQLFARPTAAAPGSWLFPHLFNQLKATAETYLEQFCWWTAILSNCLALTGKYILTFRCNKLRILETQAFHC